MDQHGLPATAEQQGGIGLLRAIGGQRRGTHGKAFLTIRQGQAIANGS
ncbi:hypothetical protein QE383_001040 [Pseudoxanthomonas winnipegensis]|uniref:Uncharacterized protein n=1 Tax=Pseudoxanthomonas winnipegensis TaxID=2480810 RepID=A0AAW8GA11_9GAMM|nr:hypothetical protein [Pseudoxanthomonas winnipegensis]MDQ1118732.1 hypothetical protein [Pseudoxanthomonas winnipegensis]